MNNTESIVNFSVTWVLHCLTVNKLHCTYLCESSNSNGVDQFVKKKDHLVPVVNKSAKLGRTGRKCCPKRERKTHFTLAQWQYVNSRDFFLTERLH